MAFVMYLNSTLTASQILMPHLSGLFAIYWVNLQRTLVGNNRSSTVMFSPGLHQTMQLSTSLSQTESKQIYPFRVEIVLYSAYQIEKISSFCKSDFCPSFLEKKSLFLFYPKFQELFGFFLLMLLTQTTKK